MKQFRNSLFIAVSIVLSSCGTYFADKDIRSDGDKTSDRVDHYQDVAKNRAKNYKEQSLRQQEVDAPWLAGKSVPLSRDLSLPPVLRTRLRLKENSVDALGRTKVTAITPECNPTTYTLQRLASCITALVGVPVRLKPDALLPASQFALRRAGTGAAPAAASSGPSANQPTELLSVAPVDMDLNTLLDLADATWGVNHRVTETGTIEIFRLETRVLRLKALAQNVTNEVTSSAGFKEESKTTTKSTANDILVSMKTSLLAMGTVAGSVEVNADSKSVVVTDTPDSIARMEAYLETENKRLTRRVTLIFEELFVTNKHGREVSIDWSLLYKRASDGAGASISSPKSLVSTNPGSLGFSAAGNSQYTGSTAILQALDEMGLTVTRRTFPVSTLNGNAQTIGLPTVFDYVASVASNVSTSTLGSVSAPTITQKEDKYGVFLTVTPEAQDDGQILVSLNLADRTGTLTPYTVQVQGSGTTVQQRNIQEANLTGRTVVRTGVTHLIGGLDETVNGTSARRFDEKAPLVLGGSDSTNQASRRIILLVTAVAEDSI
jgi:type IVB pilus formation R64 PilN family outer membrane protein